MRRFEAWRSSLKSTSLHIPRAILLGLLRAYKRGVSPMLLPACRYVPTCSDYASEAVERYGALGGGLMAVWRLLRCHPFARGGFDPVRNRGLAPTTELSRSLAGTLPFSDAGSHTSH
jgi:uncharacterized protein